ncbi:MAG: DUF898 domain-containing protein [bacterium]|nr:DUF898 domain-containing protein [bacterium]
MVKRFDFKGQGGSVFAIFFVGMLLTMITFGIYMPWFICKLQRYVYDNTTLKTDVGEVRLSFTGEGGELFGIWIVGIILCMITLGIYGPWFMVKMAEYMFRHSHGKTADGKEYHLKFNGTGGDLFVTFLVGYLLTMITFGIYGAWFMCSLSKFYADNSTITDGVSNVGSFQFNGQGGELLGTWIVGIILTLITFGIYGSWFRVKLLQFFNSHTYVNLDNEKYVMGFTGEGGELLVIHIVGYLLSAITLGIYGAWYFCNLKKFNLNNTTFQEVT